MLLRIEGQDVVVDIQDVHGLVNINTARPALLAAFFTGILGAEGAEIAERLVPLRRRDRRWTNTRELVRLGLVDHFAFARLQPHLTVYSGRPELELSHASAELRHALADGKFDRAGARNYSRGARLFQIGIRVEDRAGGSAATIRLTNGRRVEVAVVALAGN